MKDLIVMMLLMIIGILTYKLIDLKEKYELYYNNYKQCLKALSEYDSSLKDYLEKEGKL